MSLHNLYTIFKSISAATILIPIISCIINLKTLDRKLRVLFIFLLFSLLVEILSRIFSEPFPLGYQILNKTGLFSDESINLLSSFFSKNRLNWYYALANVFTLFQFFTFAFIYYGEFNNLVIKKTISVGTLLFTIVALIVWFPMRHFLSGENITTIIEATFFFMLSLYFFYIELKEMNITKLKENAIIWFNSAVLIYFSVTLILFIVDDYLSICPRELFMLLWSLNLLANIAFNILLGIAIRVWKRDHLE